MNVYILERYYPDGKHELWSADASLVDAKNRAEWIHEQIPVFPKELVFDWTKYNNQCWEYETLDRQNTAFRISLKFI